MHSFGVAVSWQIRRLLRQASREPLSHIAAPEREELRQRLCALRVWIADYYTLLLEDPTPNATFAAPPEKVAALRAERLRKEEETRRAQEAQRILEEEARLSETNAENACQVDASDEAPPPAPEETAESLTPPEGQPENCEEEEAPPSAAATAAPVPEVESGDQSHAGDAATASFGGEEPELGLESSHLEDGTALDETAGASPMKVDEDCAGGGSLSATEGVSLDDAATALSSTDSSAKNNAAPAAAAAAGVAGVERTTRSRTGTLRAASARALLLLPAKAPQRATRAGASRLIHPRSEGGASSSASGRGGGASGSRGGGKGFHAKGSRGAGVSAGAAGGSGGSRREALLGVASAASSPASLFPEEVEEELGRRRAAQALCVAEALEGCVLRLPSSSSSSGLLETRVVVLPEALGWSLRPTPPREWRMRLEYQRLSLFFAASVACGVGRVPEMRALAALLLRVRGWRDALRYVVETLPRMRSQGLPENSEVSLPHLEVQALRLLLAKARPSPRVYVRCAVAAERLLDQIEVLQREIQEALVLVEKAALKQTQLQEAADAERERLERLAREAEEASKKIEGENGTAEDAIAARRAEAEEALARVLDSMEEETYNGESVTQRLLVLEQQIHSYGLCGLSEESLFHDVVAICAWLREGQDIARKIAGMRGEGAAGEEDGRSDSQPKDSLAKRRRTPCLAPFVEDIPSNHRKTEHLWKMVHVYEPLRRKCRMRIESGEEALAKRNAEGPPADPEEVMLKIAPLVGYSKRFLRLAEPIVKVLNVVLDRVLRFEFKVRALRVVGPLESVRLPDAAEGALLLKEAPGFAALRKAFEARQRRLAEEGGAAHCQGEEDSAENAQPPKRLDAQQWKSLVADANNLGVPVESASLVLKLQGSLLQLQRAASEAANGRQLESVAEAEELVRLCADARLSGGSLSLRFSVRPVRVVCA